MRSDAVPLAGRVFVDTNVFLYDRDDRFPEKKGMARHWLEVLADRGLIVVSLQVLGELHAVILCGRLWIDPQDTRQETLALEEWSEGATGLARVGDA
ncbi:hypothetical protein [Methylobacterium marchantiae]|uniref:PIN domain-containing protein n=1 Tax=Methylobacterium marchantiae TaxID=600331 RepID=A0ABW3WVX3_9HYPH|nr:hypothetical protein AIGOOFII_0536 [Methylobacterium marchantiae]